MVLVSSLGDACAARMTVLVMVDWEWLGFGWLLFRLFVEA